MGLHGACAPLPFAFLRGSCSHLDHFHCPLLLFFLRDCCQQLFLCFGLFGDLNTTKAEELSGFELDVVFDVVRCHVSTLPPS